MGSHLQTVAATTHGKLDCADAYKHIPVRCYICHNYSTTTEEDPRCVYLGTTLVTTHSLARSPAAGSTSTRTTPARTSSECCLTSCHPSPWPRWETWTVSALTRQTS